VLLVGLVVGTELLGAVVVADVTRALLGVVLEVPDVGDVELGVELGGVDDVVDGGVVDGVGVTPVEVVVNDPSPPAVYVRVVRYSSVGATKAASQHWKAKV